ncbi:hypothetical protein [Streptomyces sp. S1D4-20]|uniref:hypothetical protein n=1 Tax=Streptomyces sp. S1D4-20 TaxID=2594462 RepID=UPI0011637586|nr:hypothetical protein [Streptomyces sp. S1D4-20]QDN54218.1 hypothetical protein FNV67_01220 [Streptomyces sp. S1D4-20]
MILDHVGPQITADTANSTLAQLAQARPAVMLDHQNRFIRVLTPAEAIEMYDAQLLAAARRLESGLAPAPPAFQIRYINTPSARNHTAPQATAPQPVPAWVKGTSMLLVATGVCGAGVGAGIGWAAPGLKYLDNVFYAFSAAFISGAALLSTIRAKLFSGGSGSAVPPASTGTDGAGCGGPKNHLVVRDRARMKIKARNITVQ